MLSKSPLSALSNVVDYACPATRPSLSHHHNFVEWGLVYRWGLPPKTSTGKAVRGNKERLVFSREGQCTPGTNLFIQVVEPMARTGRKRVTQCTATVVRELFKRNLRLEIEADEL